MTTPSKMTEEQFAGLVLFAGGHDSRQQGTCFNEAVAWYAGEPHSASPKCECPVICAFTTRLNDRIRDDAERTAFMKRLVPIVVGTRSTKAVEGIRAYMAIDFAIRVAPPQWLDLCDELKAHAVALRGLDPIRDRKTAQAAAKACEAARTAAWDVQQSAWAGFKERIKEKVLAAIAASDAIDASAAIAAIDASDASAASAASAAIAAIAASAASAAIAASDASDAIAASAASAAIDAIAAIAASAAIDASAGSKRQAVYDAVYRAVRKAAREAVEQKLATGPYADLRKQQLQAATDLVIAMAAVTPETVQA